MFSPGIMGLDDSCAPDRSGVPISSSSFSRPSPHRDKMPARKRVAIKPGTMGEQWRERIQTSMIINRLTSHIKGEVVLESSQVTAALGLLKKTAPDLQAVTLSGDEKSPMQMIVTWLSEK